MRVGDVLTGLVSLVLAACLVSSAYDGYQCYQTAGETSRDRHIWNGWCLWRDVDSEAWRSQRISVTEDRVAALVTP